MKDVSSEIEILQFAIGREVQAHTFYTTLANRMADERMGELLLAFAEEELEHKAKLEFELVKRGNVVTDEDTMVPDDEEMSVIGADGGMLMDYQATLEMAINKENESFRLYAGFASMTKDVESREILFELAEEELKHKMRFEEELRSYLEDTQ